MDVVKYRNFAAVTLRFELFAGEGSLGNSSA